MKITFYGHACIGIETGKYNLLIDPFITNNDLAKDIIDVNTIKADYILLTHAHFDHVADTELIGLRTNAIVVSNWEIVDYYLAKGLKGHHMNIGGSWDFPFGKLKYVSAVHSSKFSDGSYGGVAGGFVLQADGKTLYIAGDTALTMDMKLIPMTCPELDLAILPVGDDLTMGVNDAILASDFVNCKKILGYHYDTFPYIQLDKNQAINGFKAKDKELILLEIGEAITI